MPYRWALLLVLAVRCPAQDISAKVDDYIQAAMEARRFMGSVLIARDGKILVSKGYGMANLEHDVPNTPKTKFRLGSITKQFASAAILQLEEKGKLKTTDPICQYIADCPGIWKPVTIHHLLSHTSGIWNFTSSPDYPNKWMLESRPEQTMKEFRDRPLDFEPGSKFSYSNSGYILLALIIEKVSGHSWEGYVKENIFGKVPMNDTGHDTHAAILKHRATGYWNEKGAIANSAYHAMSIPIGGGDLYSTVEDLYRWDQALYTEKVLSRASLEKAFTPVRDNYGYGWRIETRNNRRRIGHGGGINGFTTAILRFPDDKAAVIVLSNYMQSGAGRVADDLAAILFGEKYEVPKASVEVKVDTASYANYVGKYEIAPNFAIAVTREDGRIFGQATGQPRFEMFPEAEGKFFLKVVEAKIEFTRDGGGKVAGLVLHQGGRDVPGKKVE